MISFSILSSFLIWAAKTFAKSDLQITSPGFLSCDHLSLEAADRFGLVSGGQRSMYIRMNVFICTYVYKYVRRRELHGQMLVCMFIYMSLSCSPSLSKSPTFLNFHFLIQLTQHVESPKVLVQGRNLRVRAGHVHISIRATDSGGI